MREQLILLSLLVAGACAGRSTPTTPNGSHAMTSTYACDQQLVKREAGSVFAGADSRLAMAFQDTAGDHFVAFPETPTSTRAVEYVLPQDRRADAIERVYDTTRGQSRADWRVVDENVCVVKGGYSDAFFRFANGSTMDDVASALGLQNRIEARKLIKEGMRAATVRFHREF